MDKTTVTKTAYVFDEVEKSKLLQILRYAKHRLEQHGSSVNAQFPTGLERAGIDVNFVKYLIKQMEG